MTNSAHVDEGTVYTETTIYSPPQQYAADAPYQIAIVDLDRTAADAPRRITARILADSPTERVRIGDSVTFVENRNGVAYFRKTSGAPSA